MQNSRILILHALTPLHVGTGRGEGFIDLPIARDVVCKHPLIPGSGIKGPLRAACPADSREAVFGPEAKNASDYASAVRFSDARLVAMPCPSDHGTFAWVSSPLVLARLSRDVAGIVALPDVPTVNDNQCACAKQALLRGAGSVVLDGQPYAATTLSDWPARLGELLFPTDRTWRKMFVERFAVVSDAAFDALSANGTDVRAHIRIDPRTGTVAKGALWYEESVPAEAVFASVAQFVANKNCTPARAEATVVSTLKDTVTFGGGKTTGMGVMRGHLLGGKNGAR
jgi:CRISPR-associated protein Cmr4